MDLKLKNVLQQFCKEASPHFGTCGVLVASTNVTWHLNRQWPLSCGHWQWPIEKVMRLIRRREWRLISRIIWPAGLEIPAIRFQTLAPFGRLKLIGRKFYQGTDEYANELPLIELTLFTAVTWILDQTTEESKVQYPWRWQQMALAVQSDLLADPKAWMQMMRTIDWWTFREQDVH